MKNLFKIRNLFATAIIVIFGLTSCSKSSDDTTTTSTVDNTITGKAVATADLSILVTALTRTNLAATLQGSGPYTVFAPTNDAFKAFLLANNYANLDAIPIPALTQILLNHVVSGTTTSTQLSDNIYLKTLGKGSASTSNTLSMYVAKTPAGAVKLNGISNVSIPNIVASNGIIHIVDAVIGLPTIITHAAANPAFKILVKVVTSKTPADGFGDQSAVATALTTNTSALTVFAPTDAAFGVATGTGGFANGATAAQITKVLQYHVLAGNNLAASLQDNTELTTVATDPTTPTIFQKLKVLTDSPLGARLQDKAIAPNNISKIIVTDVQCANGVIHAVDKVLKPNL